VSRKAAVSPDRLTCRHAGYVVQRDPLLLACRCVICARCKQHTGNTTQGHFWDFCKVTATCRKPHFCCPANCELENPDVE